MNWIFGSLAALNSISQAHPLFSLYFESLSYYSITFTSEAFSTWSRNIKDLFHKDSVGFNQGKQVTKYLTAQEKGRLYMCFLSH
jgi:quinol-cytochrome oxidoreductase complex cytochrome b subunit